MCELNLRRKGRISPYSGKPYVSIRLKKSETKREEEKAMKCAILEGVELFLKG
jgi:hypothetical protein